MALGLKTTINWAAVKTETHQLMSVNWCRIQTLSLQKAPKTSPKLSNFFSVSIQSLPPKLQQPDSKRLSGPHCFAVVTQQVAGASVVRSLQRGDVVREALPLHPKCLATGGVVIYCSKVLLTSKSLQQLLAIDQKGSSQDLQVTKFPQVSLDLN